MLRSMKITSRLLVLIFAGAGVLLISVVALDVTGARRIVESELHDFENSTAVTRAEELTFVRSEIQKELHALSRMNLALGSVGLCVLALLAWLIARSITRPICELDGVAKQLAGGNLDMELPPMPGRDEVACLAASLDRMRSDLIQHIDELQRATAARARMDSELQIARDIQLGLVPPRFSFEPPRPEFSVFATLDPAREVGGDFYDFFMLNDHSVCLAIGDVSGKGIPAALFMAMARTSLRNLFQLGVEPSEALFRLNNELALNNDANMFVTIFCAVIDLQTGECRYVSGGHNPPLIQRSNGDVEWISKVSGAIVGPMEGLEFQTGNLVLQPGDILFTYTDGVTEAENGRREFYGEERLQDQLASDLSPEGLLDAVRAGVQRFAEGAEQSDDITMLAFRFAG